MSVAVDRPAAAVAGTDVRGNDDRWELALPSVLILVGAIIPALLVLATGVASLPRNDDWSYRSIAMDLFQTGQLRFDGASQSFAVGQILLTVPILAALGGDARAFWLVGTIASIVVVAVGYALARPLVGRQNAALIVLTLVIVPGYLAYSSSFMTDLPALAGQLLCLLIGSRAIAAPRVRMGWALVAIAVGIIAFSVRQFAIAAPAAIVVAAIWVEPRRGVLLAIAMAVGAAVLTLLTASIAGQVGSTPILPAGGWRVGSAILSLALLMLPVSAVSLWRRRDSGSRRTMLFGVAVLASAILVAATAGSLPWTLGNLFSAAGSPADGYLIGGRPDILSPGAWAFVQLLAMISVVPLGDAVARTAIDLWRRHEVELRNRDASAAHFVVLVAFVAFALGGLLVYALGFVTVDRYLWPVVIPLGILLLLPGKQTRDAESVAQSRGQRVGLAVVLSVWGGVAVLFLLNSMAFDRGRWDAGEALASLGSDRSQIDAGYEWLGTYAPGPARVSDRQVRPEDSLSWYANIWPEFQRCAFVAGKPLAVAGFEQIDGRDDGYTQYLIFGTRVPLYLYRSTESSCKVAAP